MRVLWRLSHPPPPLPAGYARWERGSAEAAHIGLYVLIFMLPISGWLHDSAFKDAAAHPLRIFWVIPWFRIGAISELDPATKETLHSYFFALHVWAGYALYALVALHILGALKHQLIDGEPALSRMRIGAPPGQ
jgi:cytochrome b561